MKNKSLSSLIKKVSFIAVIGVITQGCALLHLDNGNFDDLDSPNSSNPYNQGVASQSDQQRAEDDHQNRLLSAISHQDIVMGMDESQVMAAWGSPRDVETAGTGGGNERWLYYPGNSLTYGMSKPRIVYFENGHVVGWESSRR
jgi:hypothetical protein